MQNSPKNKENTSQSGPQDQQNNSNPVESNSKKLEISAAEYEEMRKRAHEIAQGILHGPDAVEAVAEPSDASEHEMRGERTASSGLPSDTEMSPAEVERQMKSIHHANPMSTPPEHQRGLGIVDTINTMILEKQENIRRRDEENAIDRADMQGLQLLKDHLGNPDPEKVIGLSRALAALGQPDQKAA